MRAVGFAALTAVTVLLCGFALQWVALPRAGRGDVVAAKASQWLARYRESTGTIVVHGRTLRDVCLRGWIGHRRGTSLHLSDGAIIWDIPPHTLVVGAPMLRRPVAALEAAGCTRVLSDRLAQLSQFDGGVKARPAQLDGVESLAVDFPSLTLYVDAQDDRPFAVRNHWAAGTFRLVPIPSSRGLR